MVILRGLLWGFEGREVSPIRETVTKLTICFVDRMKWVRCDPRPKCYQRAK